MSWELLELNKPQLIAKVVEVNSQLIYYRKECDRVSFALKNQERQFHPEPIDRWWKKIKTATKRADRYKVNRDQYRLKFFEALDEIEVLKKEIKDLHNAYKIDKTAAFIARMFVYIHDYLNNDRNAYNEFILLITAYHHERFRVIDVSSLFGRTHGCFAEFLRMLKKGYFAPLRPKVKNINRNQYFYITLLGQERLQEIFNTINHRELVL